MQGFILQTKQGSRFRFGKALGVYPEEMNNAQKNTSNIIHSDTLFSALINAWAITHPETIEMFIEECRAYRFKLSSGYYHIFNRAKKQDIYLLPKPISLNLYDFSDLKKLRRIEFISKAVYEQGIMPDEWFMEDGQCLLLQNNTIVVLKKEIEKPFKIYEIETLPKVKVRGTDNNKEDSFYYQTDLYLLGNAEYGVDWYFLYENTMLNPDLSQHLVDSLTTLVSLGIGGERSIGVGALTGKQEINDLDFNHIDSDYAMSISLVFPSKNELDTESMYKIIKRGGRYIEGGDTLPMVHALQEGAILNKHVQGRIECLLNSNPPILRFGLNINIPLHCNYIANCYEK